MLIYNYQKEFIGIDESDLKTLGFSNLSQLRNESADFADLFVKTPGFVHNFKHVHWIDFVTCADSSEDSKVIIHANGKNFKAILDIKTVYLIDDPSQKAYTINLLNLRILTDDENGQVAGDVLEKPIPKVSKESIAIFNTSDSSPDIKNDNNIQVVTAETAEKAKITHDPYETDHYDNIEQESSPNITEDIYEDIPITLDNELLEIDDNLKEFSKPEVKETLELEEEQIKQPIPTVPSQEIEITNNYIYDPYLASDELGLPVDLIEEFIQDFISQANEFKNDLYNSLNDANIDNVKILSHKLKGVAANLRIEDAFEALSVINTSNDTNEIKAYIDNLYIIISKLSNKDTQKNASMEIVEEQDDDELVLSFKDDFKETEEDMINKEQAITDSEIKTPKLLDDDFLAINSTFDETPKEIKTDESNEDLITISLEENEHNQAILDDSSLKYNKAQTAKEIGIDEQSFEILFNDFIVESNKACSEINSAIEQNENIIWKEAAIKLKGMSDNMRINDFTAEIESIIHTQDPNRAKKAIDFISSKLEQISGKKV